MELNRSRLPLPLIVATLYLFWNLAAWWISEPQAFGDTYRYLDGTILDIQNPGITPVLIYTTLENPKLITLAQILAYSLAWLMLAAVVTNRLRSSSVALLIGVGLLVLSMTTPLWSWNTFLSSESLSFTATTLWLATLIWARDRASTPGAAVTAVVTASAVLVITRPAMVAVVMPTLLIFGVWLWRREARPVAGVLTFIGFVPFAGYALVRLQLLAGDEVYRYRYAINNYVDKTSSFRAHADANMPACEPLVNAVNGPAPWDEVWILKEQLINICPESFLWLRSESTSLLKWSLATPGEAIGNFLEAMPRVLLQPYSAGRAMPDAVSSLLIPDWPAWLLVIIYTAIGIVLAVLAGAKLRITPLWLLGAATMAASCAAYLYAVWGADGIELNRHLLPLTAMLMVALVSLPCGLLKRPQATG